MVTRMSDNSIYLKKLRDTNKLDEAEFIQLLETYTNEEFLLAQRMAREIREEIYGTKIFIRGLIELSSYCVKDCYYCGIRKSNLKAQRYRLNIEQVMSCCFKGYGLGFRTFVLQGGEDPYYTDELMVEMVSEIKKKYPDCAITLSLGERSFDSYQKLKKAGADRYLLRHETGSALHYGILHPLDQSLEKRLQCLKDLRSLGFQVGTGFMVGSPGQTDRDLAKDMMILQDMDPEMVGIGPFVPHEDTIFRKVSHGSVEKTLFLVSLIRIMLPRTLIPSTTSLSSVDGKGREKGILSGANVIMPNLSPMDVREKYLLYNHKAYVGDEASESLENLKVAMKKIGYQVVIDRGDSETKKYIEKLNLLCTETKAIKGVQNV